MAEPARRPAVKASLDAALAATLHALRTETFTLLSEWEPGPAPGDRPRLARRLSHLSALIDDLDWRRRLARGAITAAPAPCNVGALLASLATEIELRQPECVVVVRAPASLPPAWVDALRLRDVLLLVALEVVRRAASSAPTLEMQATSQAGWLTITLAAGLRLSERDAAALFAPLELLPRRLLRFGPGLFVARTLARRLNGRLRLRRCADGEWSLVLTVPQRLER
jgi:hypothetical protein